MIISMTGFSSAIIELPIKDAQTGADHMVQVSLTLKTLNSRFFEAHCRLPGSLSFLETDLIRYLKKELYRGSVQFTIYMSTSSALTGVIEPALATVRGYLSAIQTIEKECNITGSITINDLIHLPNIFQTYETPLDEKTLKKLWNAIFELTKKCQEMRLQEGAALEKDLSERVQHLRKYMTQLEPLAKKVTEDKKKQLIENLRLLLVNISSDTSPESHISATYNQLEKIDIHEEIVRFITHLNALESILSSSEVSKGKKIDFTLQELFRETNTIASKCSNADISSLAISMKVELEKAREQAQNIV